jgi:NADPH:quinone reductase-like Zn-dependent oxidoreductase
MKAVVYEKKKVPDQLIYQDVEKPLPGKHEVLVKIHAVSINAADYRSMRMGIIPKRKIFGADIAGRVDAVGSACTKFIVGDQVFGDLSGCGFGGFAEYVAVPETVLAKKSDKVSFEDASALPMASLTALQALRNQGGIKSGQKVLVCGAGGGVGTFAVQLAKHFGAEVTAVCSPYNVELVQSLGADHVIDYSKEDFAKSPQRYDLVLGVNGTRSLAKYKRVLTPKGIFVAVGGGLSQVFSTMLFGSLLSVGGKKLRLLAAKPDVQDLADVMSLVEAGKIKPIIDRHYPLEKTAEAMQYLSKGHARGKVVIQVASHDNSD